MFGFFLDDTYKELVTDKQEEWLRRTLKELAAKTADAGVGSVGYEVREFLKSLGPTARDSVGRCTELVGSRQLGPADSHGDGRQRGRLSLVILNLACSSPDCDARRWDVFVISCKPS